MSKRATCRCSAYRFPHRFQSGQCTGWQAVEQVFENGKACRECQYSRDTPDDGRECVIEVMKYSKMPIKPTKCEGLDLVVKDWT